MAGVPGEGQAKKLIDLAQLWVAGSQEDSTVEDGAVFGLELPAPEPQVFDIHPDAEEAITWFFRICTQWRVTSGTRIGLDYGVVLSLLSLYQVADPVAMLEDLQVMEEAALLAMQEAS